jgi:phosphotriesterase-related protein
MVLGSIVADEIGVTLPHEHLLIDFEVMFVEPTPDRDKARSREPVSLANLERVRQNFNANLDNLRLVDEQVAKDEILLFKDAGGRTMVDPAPPTLARDPLALARIARATGLNMVMGAGYYVAASHPPDMDRLSVDELTREMIADITVGVGDTGGPLRAHRRDRLHVAVDRPRTRRRSCAPPSLPSETGAPLMIHPGRNPGAPMEIAEFVEKKGGDLRRTIMCHICRTITADVRAVIDLAQAGLWLESDLFGLENSIYPYHPAFDMPNDGGRMATCWR